MRTGRYKKPDFYSGICLFFIGAITCFFSWRIGLGKLSEPAPGFMPFWAGIILTSLSLLLVIQALLSYAAVSRDIKFKLSKVLCVLGAMVAYGFLLDKIGFVFVTFLFITFMMKFMGPMNWAMALLGGVISSLGSYLLFVYFLKTQLPCSFLGYI